MGTSMALVEEKLKPGGLVTGAHNLLAGMKLFKEMQDHPGIKKQINSELWHACAGPLVALPQVGSLVYYFPQGHSEQVAVSTNKTATTQIPNYPNLPAQLLCQVQNVTLHADKDTDEIYAKMSLQPVNSEKDVTPIPDFGLMPSKHPTEYFCKTLTASDTSTHGGFSVPRRAAEKLFPQLDYSMQPPNQELVVRDLHNNTWTFRHIYRGQPKRHLLTTGWSMFIGAKRLRAGDSVLFIRDEKSQLLLGVRRANRQQTTLPSSVLSADSMHIGILAAAAHAAASRSPFTIFYNPRACPSDFVIPFSKYQKAVYSTLHVGARFAMMFETEESSKRRYMGTITGISDLDPLRWPNSKWRSLKVEWDEPGCIDKQTRVSPWEIETPDLFIFPSLTANLKRPFHFAFAGAQTEWETLINRPFHRAPEFSSASITTSLWSDQLMNMLARPSRAVSQVETMQGEIGHFSNSSLLLPGKLPAPNKLENQMAMETSSEITKLDDVLSTDQLSQFQSMGQFNDEKVPPELTNPPYPINGVAFMDQNNSSIPFDSYTIPTQLIDPPQLEPVSADAFLPQYFGQFDYNSYTPIRSPPSEPSRNPCSLSTIKNVPPSFDQDLWDPHFDDAKCVYQPNLPILLPHQEVADFHYTSSGLKDLSDENHSQSDVYSCFNLDGRNSGSTVIDPSVSSTVLEDFSALNSADDLPNPCNYLVGNLCSNRDVQSQITSASIADSQALSVHEYGDNSGGGASSSNVDFGDNNVLQHGSWQQVPPRFRTYTKIQKAGSVGRSIDVSLLKNYEELRHEIEVMFGLEGLLNDLGSGWKLVYVDFENDVLLVGDDPWEGFVGCVKCIRILSPSEVQQMGEEGMQILNSVGLEAANVSTSQVV